MERCVSVICKYHAIVYKRFEYPWILESLGVLEPIPHGHDR